MDWLPEELHPVAMRLARADQLAYEVGQVALAWSRGPDDKGAVQLRQVERTPGVYDVEVASIRPVPPLAAVLFSEAIHHLRSAVDNAVFYMAEKEHGKPLTATQERAVSMLIYEKRDKYEEKIKSLVRRQRLPAFEETAALGKRIASLQPFNDDTTIPSLTPVLAMVMGAEPIEQHPLTLVRDYSNEDKHRAIRSGLGRTLVQRPDDWDRSVSLGMREMEVGTVLEQVRKGEPTGVEISPALHVQRPENGEWIAPGPELDGIARHVANIVIPTLVTGMALPDALPVEIDLGDTGETLLERAQRAGRARAHDRMREVANQAYFDSLEQDVRFPPIVE